MTAADRKLWIFVAVQVASRVSSGAASFALALHLFRVTGRADVMAGAVAARFGASTLASIGAGALIDRLPIGRLIILADLGFAATSLALCLAVAGESSALWLVYLLLVVAGGIDTVHALATQTLPTQLANRDAWVRMNSRLGLIDALPAMLAPLIAAVVVSSISIAALFALDAVTFALAALVTLLLRFASTSRADGAPRRSILADARLGFRRIAGNPILVGLVGFFSAMNFVAGLSAGLVSPFILSATRGDQVALALVSASGAAGALLGALASQRLARRSIVATLLALVAVGGASHVLMGLSAMVVGWMAAILVRSAAQIAANGCNQAIWQTHVPAEELGRVLGARRLLAQGIIPIAIVIGGVVGARAQEAGASGLGPLFVVCGLLEVAVVIVAARLPAFRAAAPAPHVAPGVIR